MKLLNSSKHMPAALYHFSLVIIKQSNIHVLKRTSYPPPLYFWWNVILLLLNQRKLDLTMLFLSAFWIVYPVMAAFPSSFGGIHDRATFSPQTSSIFTSWGGPGRSRKWIHGIIVRSFSLPAYAVVSHLKQRFCFLRFCYPGQLRSGSRCSSFWYSVQKSVVT